MPLILARSSKEAFLRVFCEKMRRAPPWFQKEVLRLLQNLFLKASPEQAVNRGS
ncbi:MAG: hypothetical protein H7834_10700 [Magnetococcus sp. YQC-9]